MASALPEAVCALRRPCTPERDRIITRNHINGLLFWSGWKTARVPACPPCGRRLVAWHVWDALRTLLISGSALAFGIVLLLPRLAGWISGVIVLGLCAAVYFGVFLWNRRFPPAFTMDPGGHTVDYEFADGGVAEVFAHLNGAVPAEDPPW